MPLLALVIVLPGEVGLGANDTDYQQASERFEGRPPCPDGEIVATSEWEQAMAELAMMNELAPIDIAPLDADFPQIDIVWVEPSDQTQYRTDEVPAVNVPSDARVWVACVAVAPDQLLLTDVGPLVVSSSGTPPPESTPGSDVAETGSTYP